MFDVGDQWLQRQLSNLLKQLLGSLLSDKMGQRMMEALDNYASGDNIAELIGQMRSSMWPDGYPAEARKQLPQETLHLMSLLARTKLIGSVPDDLKRLLGSSTTHKGIIRCDQVIMVLIYSLCCVTIIGYSHIWWNLFLFHASTNLIRFLWVRRLVLFRMTYFLVVLDYLRCFNMSLLI